MAGLSELKKALDVAITEIDDSGAADSDVAMLLASEAERLSAIILDMDLEMARNSDGLAAGALAEQAATVAQAALDAAGSLDMRISGAERRHREANTT